MKIKFVTFITFIKLTLKLSTRLDEIRNIRLDRNILNYVY